MINIRKVNLSDVIIIYKDPETEQDPEGHAFVWGIRELDDEFYELTVSFLADPTKRKTQRKYRKKEK